MAFTSISKEDLKDRGVTGLPDTPQLTTEEMQRKFDELAKEILVPAFNRLVEELAKETAAANIGITIPEGLEAEPNIAAIIEWLLKDSGESDRLRHSHDNKSILDSITSNVKSGYDNLVNLLSSIEEISNVVKNSENSLPTGSAIVDYMIGLGGGDMLRAVYDSDCSGVVDDSEKLGGKSPKFYEDAIEEVKEMAKNGGKNLIGDEFVPEKDYFTGDYAIKDNVLYRFVQDKAAGAWDETAVESTTIEVELHALNAKIEWKLLGTKSSPTYAALQIPIPEDLDFSELSVMFESYNAGNYIFNIPRQALTPAKGIRQGFYSSANLTGFASLNVSETTIQMGSYNQNGVTPTNVVMTVYYR